MLKEGHELGGEEGKDNVRSHVCHGFAHHAGHIMITLYFSSGHSVGKTRQEEAKEEEGHNRYNPPGKAAGLAGEGRVVGKNSAGIYKEENSYLDLRFYMKH